MGWNNGVSLEGWVAGDTKAHICVDEDCKLEVKLLGVVVCKTLD